MVSKTTFGSFFINKAQLVLMAILVVSHCPRSTLSSAALLVQPKPRRSQRASLAFKCKYK